MGHQGAATVRHEVLITVTVDQRRVRRRKATHPLDAAIEALVDEVRLFSDRLGSAGVTVDDPLNPAELSASVRLRSDPTRATHVDDPGSVAGRGHRSAIHRVGTDGGRARLGTRAGRCRRAPLLPGGVVADAARRRDWLGPLLGAAGATRTLTLVMEPIPDLRGGPGRGP